MNHRITRGPGPHLGEPTVVLSGSFSFLYLKKIKISKIHGRFEKFQNYTPVAPCLGDRGPVAQPGPKRKQKKLHLGPGAQDALNSELVKSI